MGGVELSGERLGLVLSACQLLAALGVALFVAPPLDGPSSVALALLFAGIALAAAVGLWRRVTGREEGTHAGRPGDITHDPFADPGQAAEDRWRKAVRRLPGNDDD